MSRAPLHDALRDALAAALSADRDDVEIQVTAPDWETARDREATVAITLVGDGSAEDDNQPAEQSDEADQPERAPKSDDRRRARKADRADEATDDDDDDAGDEAANGDAGAGRSSRDDDEDRGPTPEELDEEADAAADFLESLLDAFDMPGDLKIRVSDEHAEVEVVEVDGGALIGRRGQTLDAIQELVRCSLQRQFQRRTRVRIDVEGYRARRLEKLEEKTLEAIDEVLDTGKSVRLEPMDVFERKAVHGIVAKNDGVESHSQGREPGRRVIIEPA